MSSSRDDFLAIKEEVNNVKTADIISIGMPHNHYVQEAMNMNRRFLEERERLEAGGMDFKKVDREILLAGACRELYSQKSTASSPVMLLWNSAVDEAEALLYDIKEALHYAFRNRPDLLEKAVALGDNGSNADLIQYLNDAATLGRNNADLLTSAGYDMANIERAAVLSKDMAELYAQVSFNRSSDSPEMTANRDKAFTLLKTALDELCIQARYICRADKKLAASFTIHTPRKKPSKKIAETEKVPA